MSRRRAVEGAPTIPGTAVTPPRRTADEILAATARPVPPVPGQQPLFADGPTIGSLCTGYGGLDDAVQQVFGGTHTWVSDVDLGACKILAHRFPTVPNIGDLTVADWQYVVDTFGHPYVVCGGYPCQPFSLAGELKGTEDERHLWPHIARALGVLRPRYAVFENVANHLRVGFDTVLCDLADLGFDVEWDVVQADQVGAPHQRRRLFILATASDPVRAGLEGRGIQGTTAEFGGPVEDPDGATRRQRRLAASGQAEGGRARADAGRRGRAPAANSDCVVTGYDGELPAGRDTVQRGVRDDTPRRGTAAAADTNGVRRGAEQRYVPTGEPDAQWGRFASAITRWEAVTGRTAPRATDDRSRLNPEFVEWMMGIDAGHVTGVPGLSRNEQLKALGNGVVPQQAAAALRALLARSRETANA
ncbi:DNA cytosine methyltransferase [Streptomyces sp. NPDC085944]|uniref:DNA cytosine methyltransferase n=1 Tax=Streptomyces sp. NPDC085944 TaxID=3154962 RepID=UPI0034483241